MRSLVIILVGLLALLACQTPASQLPSPTPDPRIPELLSGLSALEQRLETLSAQQGGESDKQLEIDGLRQEVSSLLSLPTPTPDARIGKLMSQVNALSSSLDRVEQLASRPFPTPMPTSRPVPSPTPDGRIDELATQITSLQSRLDEVAAKVESPAPTATPRTVIVVATPTATATPLGPQAVITDGTWIVGSDILPGTYRTDNPSGSCYWARLSGFSGQVRDIISNDNVNGTSAIVEIRSDDAGFESSRCGKWTRISG